MTMLQQELAMEQLLQGPAQGPALEQPLQGPAQGPALEQQQVLPGLGQQPGVLQAAARRRAVAAIVAQHGHALAQHGLLQQQWQQQQDQGRPMPHPVVALLLLLLLPWPWPRGPPPCRARPH